jgi:hypothetical protein
MAGKTIPTATEVVLGDALASFDREQLFAMPTVDVNKAGIVLANERVKVFMPDGDGTPVEFTVSLYIQRGAMSEDEAREVAKVADIRKANANAKKQEEQDRLAREKRAAFELGQESTVHAIRNIASLNQAADVIAARVHGKA